MMDDNTYSVCMAYGGAFLMLLGLLVVSIVFFLRNKTNNND